MLINLIAPISIFLLFIPITFGQDADILREEETGISQHLNRGLEKIGIHFEAGYKGEFWANTRGGIKTGRTHLHEISLSAILDTTGAGLWRNGEFFVQILSDQGGALFSEEFVGDAHILSNIEAPHSTRIHQLWYEHGLLNRKLFLLFGIHDFNADFAVTDYGALFIHSAFGISSDISLAARPGIFPLATPGIRARFAPHESWDFLLGIYNGDPGNPEEDRHFPGPDFNRRAGALVSFEGSYHFSRNALPGTFKFGFWKNTGIFEDVLEVDMSGDPAEHMGNTGWYLITDKKIRAENDRNQGLGVFMQLGWTPDEAINEFTSYIGVGLQYTGLLPWRDRDQFGIAVARAAVNDALRNATGREGAEMVLEITYRAALHPMVFVQPDLQFVFDPGANLDLRHAVAAGVRLELAF